MGQIERSVPDLETLAEPSNQKELEFAADLALMRLSNWHKRLITPEIARMLARLHWIRFVRLACDTSEMLPVIRQATAYLKEAGVAQSRLWSYALVRDVEEALQRVQALREMGVEPFVQPYRDYDGGEPTEEQKAFARWVNRKSLFKSCTWESYKK